MAVDLAALAAVFTLDTVIFSVMGFLAGMGGVISYHRLRRDVTRQEQPRDDSITEAVVMEYSRRLRDYDRVIAEMRSRLDIMELRSEKPSITVTSHPEQRHVARVIDTPNITQHATPLASDDDDRPDSQNGTTDYILKMLAERPRTAREVQQSIGRSREHTSRLMKKLAGSQLVAREMNAKPFKYAITDLGRERLKERVAEVSELQSP